MKKPKAEDLVGIFLFKTDSLQDYYSKVKLIEVFLREKDG